MWSIKIGLVGDGYCYQIGDYVSAGGMRTAKALGAMPGVRRGLGPTAGSSQT